MLKNIVLLQAFEKVHNFAPFSIAHDYRMLGFPQAF